MNRKQRRIHKKKYITRVDLRAVTMPWHMTPQECHDVAIYRLGLNLGETGHPMHHKTANGVIVDADPTLDYCLSRLDEADARHLREYYGKLISKDAKQAVPLNRTYYGHDPYAVNGEKG